MRKFDITNNEIYHIFNRGVEKRKIFLSQNDYERFIVNLILFNTVKTPTRNISRYDLNSVYENIPDDNLVKIHAFSLMPTHFHLILEQVVKNGIARFLHRIEMGYSHYINKFYSRTGHLFQGAYKIIHIDNDAYRLYVPLYVHLNPLELLDSEREWKERGIKNKTKAINFLKDYPWSSFGEYLKTKSFPFISHDILDELYENPERWEDAIKEWSPEDNVHHSVVHKVHNF